MSASKKEAGTSKLFQILGIQILADSRYTRYTFPSHVVNEIICGCTSEYLPTVTV